MDSNSKSTKRWTSSKTKFARTFSKILNIRSDKFPKPKTRPDESNHQPIFFNTAKDEKLQEQATMAAFIAKLFATLSSIKSAYAKLQYAQFPYDSDGIQSADQIIVQELKTLSESKQSFLKKHLDDSTPPETTHLMAEIEEQTNLLKTYEITTKKLDYQTKLKESEIIFLKEKLHETRRENKLIEKRLNLSSSGPLSSFSSLTPTNFVTVLKQTMKSIRTFVRFLITGLESAKWDLDSVASSIHPNVVSWDGRGLCYAFESFICREMFDRFNFPEFSKHGNRESRRFFFDKFTELKTVKTREYIKWQPESAFAGFCKSKYLKLVHPKMELSLFGNLDRRNQVATGKWPEREPESGFSDLFLEVAKGVWLLHCLAFSFSPEVTVFQVAKGGRFSEVFMDCVNEEVILSSESSPEVGFTVVPGFKVGKTVIQCQVYLV